MIRADICAEFEISTFGEFGSEFQHIRSGSDSFVENFTRLIEAGMWNANVSVVDLGGVARSCGNFTCTTKNDSSGVTTKHILVGAGATPVSSGDCALADQIPDSVLSYKPSLVLPEVPHIDGGFIKSRIAKRAFVNVTDSPVEISEIGIAVLASGYNIMILRDVLPESISVPARGVVDISYTFKCPSDGGFTLNYMNALACSVDGSAIAPVVDTGGVSRSVDFGGTFPANALTEQGHYGILIGASGSVPTGDEHSLVSPIPNGRSAGSLYYGAVRCVNTIVKGNAIEFSLTRGFINLTSESIVVREIGLVSRHSGYNILLERNVIDPIEIPPYDGVNVTITHRTVI